ncbi:MAG TPA: hypothetical protein VFA84_00765 [Acidimicrobiales bacterium]|nr:hypothetical protein [Acidimicrobiales bacterium]
MVMRWCQLTLTGRDGRVLARIVLQGRGIPDIAAVDEVARWMLRASRLGIAVRVGDASSQMAELLALAGLPVEVDRQPEGGEQALGVEEVEEEVHPGDPAR